MRVAQALGELPVLEAALSLGELSFSAVRELSRVATKETDAAWTSAAKGKNLRQIETLVTGRRAGDLPDDPPDADVRMHVVRFELSPETFAAMRQARSILDTEHRTNLTDDDFITVLTNMVLEGVADFPTSFPDADDACIDVYPSSSAVEHAATAGDRAATEMSADSSEVGSGEVSDSNHAQLRANRAPIVTRAKYQIAVTLCPRCRQGWQLGAGAVIAIGPAAVARAECDAQHVGDLDAVVPQRAYQDISPAVARLVWRRDEGRCQTPGCRSARGLEIHHVVPRARGGSHEPSNLRLACSSCHHAQHDDRLAISGDGERMDIRTAELAIRERSFAIHEVKESSKMAASSAIGAAVEDTARGTYDNANIRAQAKDALVGLGWKPAISRAAVDAAMAELGVPSLDALIREALRRCPSSRT